MMENEITNMEEQRPSDVLTAVPSATKERCSIDSTTTNTKITATTADDGSFSCRRCTDSTGSTCNTRTTVVPKIGPNPTLLHRKEVDALYEMFYHVVVEVFQKLNIQNQYIITGGTLLGSIRQHSILFCDDDIDIAILENDDNDINNNSGNDDVTDDCVKDNKHTPQKITSYELYVQQNIHKYLDCTKYIYQIKPWEGCDRIRHIHMNNVYIDIFAIRIYRTENDLRNVLCKKKNGTDQTQHYIDTIINTIKQSAGVQTTPPPTTTTTTVDVYKQVPDNDNDNNDEEEEEEPLFPCYHFTTRKAIEMWPKEVYRPYELFPLIQTFKLGPYDTGINGPCTPIRLLYRAFGTDCFDVYYQSNSHTAKSKNIKKENHVVKQEQKQSFTTSTSPPIETNDTNDRTSNTGGSQKLQSKQPQDQQQNQQQQESIKHSYPPLVLPAGQWGDNNSIACTGCTNNQKIPLQEEQYIPMQPTLRALRRPTLHNKQRLIEFIQYQIQIENEIIQRNKCTKRTNAKCCTSNSTESTIIVKKEDKKNNTDLELKNDDKYNGMTLTKDDHRYDDEQGIVQLVEQNEYYNTDQDEEEIEIERQQQQQHHIQQGTNNRSKKNRTVYMDGVFDLFHIGHLEAIKQCATLGNRVIIGITGDIDATGYKRPPILSEKDRTAIVASIRYVDEIICPCPLIVTEQFMIQYNIDLVVHGFANDIDSQRQEEFFAIPQRMGKFQRISYYKDLSTTDIINKIQQLQRSSNINEAAIESNNPIQDKNNNTSTTNDNDNNIIHDSRATSDKKACMEYQQNECYITKVAAEATSSGCSTRGRSSSSSSNRNSSSKWFSEAVSLGIGNTDDDIPYDPIPLSLRVAIEPHISKARRQRTDALERLRSEMMTNEAMNENKTENGCFDAILTEFIRQPHIEGEFTFDTTSHDLRAELLACTGFVCDLHNDRHHALQSFDLSLIHENSTTSDFNISCTTTNTISTESTSIYNNTGIERINITKNTMLHRLTQNYIDFQLAYDKFICEVIAPKMSSMRTIATNRSSGCNSCDCTEIYYQSFPCIRVIQPNEFSIGPHADVGYGHHPCSINFYVPLTPISGTSSVFMESRMGSEDWHPIVGDYGYVKHFAGAVCAHWTTVNKTNRTRVSLDFRLIDGRHFNSIPSVNADVYRLKEGYYSTCRLLPTNSAPPITHNVNPNNGSNSNNVKDHHSQQERTWQRVGTVFHKPDARMGFPWTVKDWTQFNTGDDMQQELLNR